MLYLFLATIIIAVVCMAASIFETVNVKIFKNSILKQVIIGLVFGLVAILCTNYCSFQLYGASISVRESIPVCAGLLFGPWSAIISGLIGGVHRYIAGVNGLYPYTQIAETIACLATGAITAIIKVTIFKKKKPIVMHGLVIIVIVETIELALIPLTNLNDFPQSMLILTGAFIPALGANSLAVILSFVLVAGVKNKKNGLPISELFNIKSTLRKNDLFFSFQIWIIFLIIASFTLNTFVSAELYESVAFKELEKKVTAQLDSVGTLIQYDYSSTDNTITQSAVEFVNRWTSEAKYASDQDEYIYYMVVDGNNNILSDYREYGDIINELENHEEYTLFSSLCENKDTGETNEVLVMYIKYGHFKMVSYSLAKYQLYLPHISASLTSFIQILIFSLLLLFIFLLLKQTVGKNLDKVNNSLSEITRGNLDEVVNVFAYKEFSTLSKSINKTVKTLKKYIKAEKDRYFQDLELARQIQMSAMPSVFPAYPEREEFDLYATYNAAKIVGGDFYDFYFVEPDRLAFLIADVSGKGVSGAMFMMKAKSAIRAFAEKTKSSDKTLQEANNYLCENNDAEMFITCWFGILDLNTGELEFSNAGHNYPVLIQNNKKACYLKKEPQLVLGGIENIKYVKNKTKLQNTDKLFLYTDGLTEANNNKKQLFGQDRLLQVLDLTDRDKNVKQLCQKISNDITMFINHAEQFDDITMLAIEYLGPQAKSKIQTISSSEVSDNKEIITLQKDFDNGNFCLTTYAKVANVSLVVDFVNDVLDHFNCDKAKKVSLDIVIDELFSNIANYAYKDQQKTRKATIKINVDKNKPISITVTFIDKGEKFNPLDAKEPDITLSADEREIGGLGLLMVKKMVDKIDYKYKDGKNHIIVTKNI